MKTVIIAENERIIFLDLKSLLQKKDFKILPLCTTGNDLIEECKLIKPDLIITNFNLEGEMSGLEAIKNIVRSNPIPVIFISGSSPVSLKKFTNNSSYITFLSKPFMNYELLDKIYSLLNMGNYINPV